MARLMPKKINKVCPSQVQFAGLHKATICLDEMSTNVNDVNEINDMLNVTQLK